MPKNPTRNKAKQSDLGWRLRNACREILSCRDHEVIVSGPSQTGKTIACCIKAHLTAMCIPGAQGTIARKTYASMPGSVLQSFERVIAGQGIHKYGGQHPSKYVYGNGSVIWIAGMDKPERLLSTERDFIYVNQAEELTENDWEMLVTRCSGRGALVEVPQLFGDCNPGGSKHWIRERSKAGKLRLMVTTHRDNPALFTDAGDMTEDGRAQLAKLEVSLSGVRRKRLLEGIWATAEGAVYDMFDPAIHVVNRRQEEFHRFALTMDEGYTNPAVILLVGIDGDHRWHVFKEFYRRGVLQSAIVEQALAWFREKQAEVVVVDESAAGLIADLSNVGINAKGAKGRVLDGIQAIQNRLKIQGDQRPRLTLEPNCINTQNEFESYAWKPQKDVPDKQFDHAMDALRYLSHYFGETTGAFSAATIPKPSETDPSESDGMQFEDLPVDMGA